MVLLPCIVVVGWIKGGVFEGLSPLYFICSENKFL